MEDKFTWRKWWKIYWCVNIWGSIIAILLFMLFWVCLYLAIEIRAGAATEYKIPAFLQKTKTGFKEKPVIILVKSNGVNYNVMEAIFPDGTCVKYPSQEILLLPHVFKEYSPLINCN